MRRPRHHRNQPPPAIRAMIAAEICDNKIGYSDRSAAAGAQSGMGSRGKHVRVYFCDVCQKYHLATDRSK